MATNCDISRGIAELACLDAVNGLKNLYLANYSDEYFTSADFVDNATSGHTMVSLGSLGTTGTTGEFVYKFATKNTGNSFQETSNTSRDNGTSNYSTNTVIIITKLSQYKQYLMKQLVKSRPIAFLELNSGQILALGTGNGCNITYTAGVTGGEGLNGYTLTIITEFEKENFYVLSDSAAAALKLLVSPDNIND
jgi:hypothetical protein